MCKNPCNQYGRCAETRKGDGEVKSVLLSIQPKYCDLIASGRKTVEIRKTKPKIEPPFKCYIYETKGKTDTPFMDEDGHLDFHGRGQVIGEFICDGIKWNGSAAYVIREECIRALEGSCLTEEEFHNYMNYPPVNPYQDLKEAVKKYEFYGWHISDLVIYDKPKELSEFFVYCERCDKRPIACEYLYEESNESIGYYSECMCDYKRPIKRPPQSWCYVQKESD